MQPEITEPMRDEEHILADVHDIAKSLYELRQEFADFKTMFEAKVEEWEGIARPFARMRDGTRLRRLGRGRDAVQ